MFFKKICFFFVLYLIATAPLQCAQTWNPDRGDGTFQNPIIYADYSDPDVIRVGDDFYLTASSFSCFPALPSLHARDLVHWQIINHAIDIFPDSAFNLPQHGNGIWAPALRFHQGVFWIFFGDPDRGIFMVKTRDIWGKWDSPLLIKAAKGWIDPCPLWDDDGKAYLVHAFAKSRAGFNGVLHVNQMTTDGTHIADDGALVFADQNQHPTIEGPKFFKRKGYYYIFAPAGGVKTGWQTVLRATNIYGPYTPKIVLAQGKTEINGPHQGGFVELANGESWFIHFQDQGAYGRVVHLQPMVWQVDWPVIGSDPDGDGVGEPVRVCPRPSIEMKHFNFVPQTSDEFDSTVPGRQWQWPANYQIRWFSFTDQPGWVRLHAENCPPGAANLWAVPNLFLQKFPAPEFSATTKINFRPKSFGERAGLLVLGQDYATLVLHHSPEGLRLVQTACRNAAGGAVEVETEVHVLNQPILYFRVQVAAGAICQFAFSLDGNTYQSIGPAFQAQPGRWIGAKIGIFATQPNSREPAGFADFDFFRIE